MVTPNQGSFSLPSLTLFLISACDLSPSLLVAQCSPLSLSPSPLLSTVQATEHIPGTQNYLQAEKNKQHNLCVMFYKQIWLTLAELDWLCSQVVRAGRCGRRPLIFRCLSDSLTPWLSELDWDSSPAVGRWPESSERPRLLQRPRTGLYFTVFLYFGRCALPQHKSFS